MQFTQSNFLRKCELRLFSSQYTFSFSRFIQHFEADFNVVYIFVFKLQRAFVDVTFNYIWVNNAKLLITNIDGIWIEKKMSRNPSFFDGGKTLSKMDFFLFSRFLEKEEYFFTTVTTPVCLPSSKDTVWDHCLWVSPTPTGGVLGLVK